MGSKKHILKNQKEKNAEFPTAEDIAQLFRNKGLGNTSKWIQFSLNTKLPDPRNDLNDILNSLHNEIRLYKQEYYIDSTFRESCFDIIWKTVLSGMSSGQARFRELTEKLVPIMSKILETGKLLEDITSSAENLDKEPKFYLICFYYLMLMEGRFKNVKKNLLAMKRLNEGKDVKVTETLGLLTDEEIEKENNLREILPEKLKIGNHSNLRNSIAHANFRYITDENKMEFWDVYPFSQKYSMEPIRLTFNEFTNSLLEVKFFCDIFGFIVMAHIAIEDIVKRYS